MSPAMPRPIPDLLLITLGTVMASMETRYASGARRSGFKLLTEPLEERQAVSVTQCLALCGELAGCVALNSGTISDGINCQLLGQRACDGLPLVADAAVDYYDVYDDRRNLTAETQTPFWDDPGCVEGGYCAAECAAEAAGEFCAVDAHCSVHLKPTGVYRCLNSTCQQSESDEFWEVRPGLMLPRWQLWRMDRFEWTWKKLKPGTCSLDVSVKLGTGAEVQLVTTWKDEHAGTRLYFRFTSEVINLYYKDIDGTDHDLLMGVDTNGMVNSDTYSQLKVSWCGGNMAIGPVTNPTMATAFASVSQPLDFFTVHSEHADSWMRVDSGVADPWLFQEAGTATDAVMTVPSYSYVFRQIAATNEVTVKYDCKAARDCIVRLQGSAHLVMDIIVGGWFNEGIGLIYYGDSGITSGYLRTGPITTDSEFLTFTVHYSSGDITIHQNDGAIPIYTTTAPHQIPDITLVGIGGCCGPKTIRVARYDPAWRTDTWMTEGSGYSNGDEPPPAQ
ncbi:hypothetical protein FJT64_010065 [Amphibalanus amphitrite]|uniref:Farnesoic acid O-methyl transferase domain-containing protein n=1 Tax=Amphibalanus amphitrite TaxID=1232801 RepID=A0A6A4VNP5_AMPAM|nr:hypothetical protein FJT64_010065 [Amphibalanus amphitrite]